ncbi:transglutaminase domain-containing protein [Vulgatibacter sp.]|uniref:transglutaminase domain-containing protein n=1 Tax=Vulgatibacter sp. TaxID=1971226 RepID=UPI00356314BF
MKSSRRIARLAAPLLLLAFLLPGCSRAEAQKQQEAQAAPAPAPTEGKPLVRTVRLSVRVVGNGEDARLEVPLVQSDEHQTLLAEKLLSRGFQVEEAMREGNRLAILTWPKLKGAKRITYEFTVALRPLSVEVPPAPVSTGDPSPEDEPWLRSTRNLQSTSPLIREKLIHFATPRLARGEKDAIRIAWDLTDTYERKPEGSKTVLKATRTGHAADRGLDRLFATFLRTSGIPARPVQGVDVLRKRRRFTTWVEVKSGGDWLPMSVPRDQWGKLPARFVKLSHGDRPLIVRRGVEKISFRWKVTKPAAEASR